MSDINLVPVTTVYDLTSLNANFQAIQDVINNRMMHLNGGDNTMDQVIDMNGMRIINLGAAISPSDAANLSQLPQSLAVTAVQGVVAGTNITVDNTDPIHPVVSATVAVAPQVPSDWNATDGVAAILNKPVLGTASQKDVGFFATAAQGTKANTALQSIVAGDGITVDTTNPQNPKISSSSSSVVPVIEYTADHTAVLADVGTIALMNSSSPLTFTVDPTTVSGTGLVRQKGDGQVTIAVANGTAVLGGPTAKSAQKGSLLVWETDGTDVYINGGCAGLGTVTLDATFPPNVNVGDTVNFDVTAALSDGASGAPTISVDQLPNGLSLGATTIVDTMNYKATVSGTRADANEVVSTFTTAGASVNASPLIHDFIVANITLSANFPTNLTQGDAVNFDVTATVVGNVTGTLVIAVDQLPDGLTLGSTSGSNGTYTATVSGTVTTAQDIISTFTVTGGNVSPTPLVNEFNISSSQAGASAAWVAGDSYDNNGVSGTMPLPAGVEAGDYLLFMTNDNPSKTFTLTNKLTIMAPTTYYGSGPAPSPVTAIYGYFVTAQDVTNGSIPLTFTGMFEVGAFRGVSQATPIDIQSAFTIGASTKPCTITVPGVTTSISGDILVFVGAVQCASGATTTPTMNQPSGYVGRLAEQVNNVKGLFLATKDQPTVGNAGSCTGASFSTNAFGNFGAMLIALSPGS